MSDPFASAQDYCNWVNIALPADLSRLQALLKSASSAIRRYCGQVLSEVANDVVVLEPIERDTLLLPERPVTAISSILVGVSGYTNYRFTRAGRIVELSGLFWSTGATVTYNHGYAESSDEYDSIKSICMEAASRAYTLNERSASEFLGSTLAESAGYSPEVFLTPGERMQLADLGKVLVG